MDFDDDLQPKEEPGPGSRGDFLLLLILIFIAIMMVVWTKSGLRTRQTGCRGLHRGVPELKNNGNIASVVVEGEDLTARDGKGGYFSTTKSYKRSTRTSRPRT
jgi:hypothetical protein